MPFQLTVVLLVLDAAQDAGLALAKADNLVDWSFAR